MISYVPGKIDDALLGANASAEGGDDGVSSIMIPQMKSLYYFFRAVKTKWSLAAMSSLPIVFPQPASTRKAGLSTSKTS